MNRIHRRLRSIPKLRLREKFFPPSCMWLPLVLLAFFQVSVAASRPLEEPPSGHIRRVLDELQVRLALAHEIQVGVVPHNDRVVSVEPVSIEDGVFKLLIEEGFLAILEDDELQGVLAHELGHVWIYNNHPYLQTESLANRVALRVVSQDILDRVYTKLSSYRK